MKKKIMAMCLVIAMAATAVIGGTLAYFTDTDSAENVMTMGNVNIIQNEQQRDANGGLVEFVQDKPLMPMVDAREEGDEVVVDGYFNSKMNNVVDKIITVTNEAKKGAINQDVYARTILAFETKTSLNADGSVHTDAKKIFDDYIGTLGDFELIDDKVMVIDGVEYVLAVKVYEDALAPAETSEPSLKQIFLAPTANNEVMNLFGEEYTILALSQAVQTAGFDNAKVALDTAFGEVTTANCTTWFTK